MLGILGGGQLGRMFVHAAQRAGHRVTVLDPDPQSPAGAAADHHLQAAYDDPDALRLLGDCCVAVTTEFENVPSQVLQDLAARLPVSPPAAAVQVCQHRAFEKACFERAGVPCAPHAVLRSAADTTASRLNTLLPGVLKTATLGYDGKGQVAVNSLADLHGAWQRLGGVPCVLEQRLSLRAEISAIVARGRDGSCVHLPVQQNLHRDGVLAVTQVPPPDVESSTADQAIALARRLAEALDYVGVLCVEFFVLQDGTLVANEMAPRPHNSGHCSIDACDLSQFDLQLRTLLGQPLVMPRMHSAAVMLNLMGDLWWPPAMVESGRGEFGLTTVDPAAPVEPDWTPLLRLPGMHLHLYGKSQPRRGRKMGHLTVTAADAAAAAATARKAAALLDLPGF
ncbi:MAG: 5-(carboxyamino)imidazole ribonucleotide synthase [Rubrivivax sp.]